MNNKVLLIAACMAVIFMLAVKFQFLPKFNGAKMAQEVRYSESETVLKHADGVDTNYFADGSVRSETPYINGVKNGISKVYYNNGNIRSESKYVNGKLNGETKTYFSNGKPDKIYTYKEDFLDGPAKSYNKEGYLETETTYRNNTRTEKEIGSLAEARNIIRESFEIKEVKPR